MVICGYFSNLSLITRSVSCNMDLKIVLDGDDTSESVGDDFADWSNGP